MKKKYIGVIVTFILIHPAGSVISLLVLGIDYINVISNSHTTNSSQQFRFKSNFQVKRF